jgi:hypothetical protein
MTLSPINRPTRITERSIKLSHIELDKNCLNGDLIDGGTITHFSSTGIRDLAENTQLTIEKDSVVIEKDLQVKGTVIVDRLQYVHAQVPKINTMEAIMIDNNEVLWKDRLGKSVKKSSLQQVGILEGLEVENTLYARGGRVGINTTVPSQEFSVYAKGHEIVITHQEGSGFAGTYTHEPFSIGTDNTARLTCKPTGEIVIHEKLGIGVKNPVEDLEVAGNIKFAGKIFAAGNGIPATGTYTTGSIIWNDQPTLGQPVGWVCIKGGQPGAWRAFALVI